MVKVGFIGLGVMGRPMAKNLVTAGYDVTVVASSGAASELVAAGAASAESYSAVASVSDVVITMLPNSPEVRHVVAGPDGVLDGARPGTVLVDMSSIAPAVSIEIGALAAERGVEFLDAPVSGGEPKAVDGSLAIMVGGDAATLDRVRPVLEVMGGSVERIGAIGAGNVAKLANQVIVAANIAAVSEAAILAQSAGVAPESVFRAIRGGLAGSTVLDAKVPMMLAHDFAPGFRIDLHVKDLDNALSLAEEVSAPVPLGTAAQEMFRALSAAGHGTEDHSAMVRHYEQQAGVQLSPGAKPAK